MQHHLKWWLCLAYGGFLCRELTPVKNPESKGLQHHHLHPHSPHHWVWLWSFGLDYFWSTICDKTTDRPYSLLLQMSPYLYTNTKAVFCCWRSTVREGLVHFSSHTKNRVSPSLKWPLAKLNTFPGLPKSLVPVWPAKTKTQKVKLLLASVQFSPA